MPLPKRKIRSRGEIYKIQVPIVTNDPEPCCLAYNEDRSRTYELPLTFQLAKVLGNSLKSFWHCRIYGKHLILVERAKDQGW